MMLMLSVLTRIRLGQVRVDTVAIVGVRRSRSRDRTEIVRLQKAVLVCFVVFDRLGHLFVIVPD